MTVVDDDGDDGDDDDDDDCYCRYWDWQDPSNSFDQSHFFACFYKKLKRDFRIFSFSLIMLSELSMKKTIPRRIIARIRPLCSVPVTWIVSWIVRFECIVWCNSVHRKNTGHIEISGTSRSPRHHTGGIKWLVLENKWKAMSNIFLYEILTYHSI